MQRALFILTIFLSSGLLFLVQPMVARMILPAYGGSPAVWTASMVFFQAFLLLGYVYAHLSGRWLGPKRQPWLHLVLLLLAATALPFTLPPGHGALGAQNPTVQVLGTLALMVGLPFFAISAGAPLIQRWFSHTRDPDASDPYFLYSASNVGSMVALLAYPLWFERALALGQQARFWAGAFVVLIALMGVCAAIAVRFAPRTEDASTSEEPVEAPPEPLTWRQRGLWIALSAVPSSLLLGVTAFLSTNIAPIPMLWVVPLALYLLTFILAFSRRWNVAPTWLGRVAPMLVTPLALMVVLQSEKPIELIGGFHLLVFFVLAWMCHSRLATSRPGAGHLTEFYVWISVGGVLGGAFNALLAPVLFDTLAEYPLAIALAVMLRPPIGKRAPRWAWAAPLVIGALAVFGVWFSRMQGGGPSMTNTMLALGIPLILTMAVMDWPVKHGLAILAVFLVSSLLPMFLGTARGTRIVLSERSFFGVHRVTRSPDGRWTTLLHGNTVHGLQDRSHPERALTYYHRTGPIGHVFRDLAPKLSGAHVALVGLGVGSLAAYGQQGQKMTFFEIDPVVETIARDPSFFTFLRSSKAEVRVVLGDARLTLANQPDDEFQLIVLDAFSSDAIPVHLLTREAMQMYLRKLKQDGVIAVHISNRYLDLEPVMKAVARDLRLQAMSFLDAPNAEEADEGKTPSVWVVLARHEGYFGAMLEDPNWSAIDREPIRVWTDDYSNVLGVFRHRDE